MNNANQLYQGYRFSPEIISHETWLYHQFCLNVRDIEDLLADRELLFLMKLFVVGVSNLAPRMLERSRNAEVYLVTHGTWMRFTS